MNFKPRPAVLLPDGGFLCLWWIGLEGVLLRFLFSNENFQKLII